MEPLLPEDRANELRDFSTRLLIQSGKLEGVLRPKTRAKVVELVRSMNGYYSNLIEGHRTKPHDIEAALKNHFSTDEKVRKNQLCHVAHLEALKVLEAGNPALSEMATPGFIRRIHQEFYGRLPDELRRVKGSDGKSYEIVPGEMRNFEVSVGQHLAPAYRGLPQMMERFSEFYAVAAEQSPPRSLVAAMAAHHRLVWIHPFGDGNGRVARLLTHLWLRSAGCGGSGLWTLSRGLARGADEYRSRLNAADGKRRNDWDGRGYLSDSALSDHCRFMLDTALDQVGYMGQMLGLEQFESRMVAFCRLQEAQKLLPAGASHLLKQVFLEDEITRGQVAGILNVSPRTGQTVVRELLQQGYLESPTPKGGLSLAFPPPVLPFLFPGLYPGF